MYRWSKRVVTRASKSQSNQRSELLRTLQLPMNLCCLSLRGFVQTNSKYGRTHALFKSQLSRRGIFTSKNLLNKNKNINNKSNLQSTFSKQLKKSQQSKQCTNQSTTNKRSFMNTTTSNIQQNKRNKLNPTQIIHNISKRNASGGGGGLEPVINNPYTGITHAASEDDFLHPSMGQYVDSLYGQWKDDPMSVDSSWQDYFQSGKFMKPKRSGINVPNMPLDSNGNYDMSSAQMVKAVNDATNLLKLARSYQAFGHFLADLDPLGILNQGVDRKQFVPELLNRNYWGFAEEDLDTPIYVGDHSQFIALMGKTDGWVTLREVETRMKQVYCGSIGVQYMHIANHHKNNFVRHMLESDYNKPLNKEDKIQILDRLMWAHGFEEFLELKYPAQKRFGINGSESFIPLVKELIDEGARLGIEEFVIGMPHRGRLLCLATVFRKPLEQILYEFRGLATPWYDIYDTGDVKYHLGASADRITPEGHKVHLSLFPNPSHLEAVNPVVTGKVRAKQTFKKDYDRSKTACILIHGDASFAGQGVVYESMALTDLPDYTTGGVFHIIVNNQIGFTTDAFQARSTPYCTDVARGIAAPIFHVNGDNPESVVKCAKYASAFRQNFKADVVVDMLCYRRFGHNEGDEPMFTQPLMYQTINNKVKSNDTVLEKYKNKLLNENVITQDDINRMKNIMTEHMQECYEKSANLDNPSKPGLEGPNWRAMKGVHENVVEISTGVSEDKLKYLGNSIFTVPDNFNIHRKLNKIMKQRKESICDSGENIDWGAAEALAYATLINEGYHVRLSGQDSERGTFSHRHAVLHEQKNIDKFHRPTYVPLQNIDGATGGFEVCNSNLSEYAVLGFEYGYSAESPKCLVLWEAQFGDFANGAQVIFDQFISSAENKWLRQSGLVVLLPHGYEGGGPEHSSSRIERYLQMCSDDPDTFIEDPLAELQTCNWQIINCTMPGNFFHALRRQVHRDFRKPLIVATPKSGLKHHLATSKLSDMTDGTSFQRVLEDDGVGLENGINSFKSNDKIRRLIFCSGKIWINLVDHRGKQTKKTNDSSQFDDVLVTRLEQLSPFPYAEIKNIAEKYPNAEIIWLQEEPKNMGAYRYVEPRFRTALKETGHTKEVRYIGRRAAASPATGYPQVHAHQHETIMLEAFDYSD